MPAEILPLNLTGFAEQKVIQIGKALEELKAVSADDIRKMDLCNDYGRVSASDALMHLAWEFQQLADDVMKAQSRAQAKEIYESFKGAPETEGAA